MKVLIVSLCGLPVPAVKGGAVPTLIESIIIQNEIHKKLDLTIISSYDTLAEKKSLRYHNTKFIFFNTNKIIPTMDNLIDTTISKLKNKDKLHRYIWKLNMLSKIKKFLKSNNYDKVVFQNFGYLLNVLKDTEISKKYKGKLYYHLHNDIPNNIYIDGLKQCKILVVSEYLKNKIINLAGNDINKQLFVLKNGFDCSIFNQDLKSEEKLSIRQKLGINFNDKVIIYAGRIVPEKGIKELTDAFAQLNIENLKLLVVGAHNFGSGQTSEFEQEIKKKFVSLKDKIKFTGYIPYNEMWKYYKISDLAVLPSIWEEPAGLTMIEAAVSGIPVVTTYSGGIPEYLPKELAFFINGDNNIVNNIINAINSILSNYTKWQENSIKAKQYIQNNFSEEIYYFNFVNILSKKGY